VTEDRNQGAGRITVVEIVLMTGVLTLIAILAIMVIAAM